MKYVSPEYKLKMDATFRDVAMVRVFFQQVDPRAALDGTYTDNGGVVYSELIDTNDPPLFTYATLEDGRFVLDGTQKFHPMSNYDYEGFVGEEISDENGYFNVNPMIEKTFTEKHSVVGLTLTFDSVLKEAPKKIIIRFYNDGALVRTIEPLIDSYIVRIEQYVSAFDKFTIEFVRALPYRRARLQKVMYGVERVFTNENIESVEQTTDIDPISRRLPTERLRVTLLDFEQEYNPEIPHGKWEYIDVMAPISIQHGLDGEWLDEDAYLLDGKPEVDNNRVIFTASRQLEHLTDKYYKSKAGLKSLYDMAEDVLIDAGVDYYIDPELMGIMTDAALPIDSHKNCLQLIAHAGMCRLYTYDKIRLEHMEINSEPHDYELSFNSAFGKPRVTKLEQLRSINVHKYSRNVSDNLVELHKSSFDGETQFYVEFDEAEDVSVSVDNGTISDIEIYAQAVSAKLAGTGEVTVMGKTVNTSPSGTPLMIEDIGEDEIVENPLVTTDEHKAELEKYLAEYLGFRLSYHIDYRGSPELEASDLIWLQSQFTKRFPAVVLKHTLELNGGWRGSGIFKGIWFKRTDYQYTGEIYANDMGVL